MSDLHTGETFRKDERGRFTHRGDIGDGLSEKGVQRAGRASGGGPR